MIFVADTSNSDHIVSKDRYTLGPTPDSQHGSPPTTSLPWGSITDRPPVLVSLGDLADGAGVLTNDGAGGLSWDPTGGGVDWSDITGTPTDLAGYGITDAVDTSTFSGFVSTLFPIAFSGSWFDLNSTPSDLAGYGITDAVDIGTFTGFVSSLAAVAFSGQATDVAFSSSSGLSSPDVSDALDELHGLITGGGGGLPPDADYGDITVSGSGTIWTIDAATITPAKITNRAALSVFGRSANSSGVGADIAAGTDAFVLRRSGTTLGFGTIGDASISALAFSKLTSTPTTRSGYGITDAQPLDSELTAIASLVSAADQLPYFTGSGSASLTTLTSFARTLLDDTTQAAMQTTLGVAPSFTVGTSLSLSAGVLNAIQDIRTSATPQWNALAIASTVDLVTNYNTTAADIFTRYQIGGTSVGDVGSGNALFVGGSASDFAIDVRGANKLHFGTNGTTRGNFDGTGNFNVTGGRADIASTAALSLNVNGTSSVFARFQVGGTSIGDIGDAFALLGSGSTSDFGLGTRGNHNLVFTTNGAERARIDGSGNFQLSTNSNGRTISTIQNTNAGTSARTDLVLDNGTDLGLLVKAGSANTAFGNAGDLMLYNTAAAGAVRIFANSAPVMSLLANGNVGIGANPAVKFDVFTAANLAARFSSSHASGVYTRWDNPSAAIVGLVGSGSAILGGGTVTDFAIDADAGNLVLATAGVERMRIATSGNVGIGGSPAVGGNEKLQVISAGGYVSVNISNTAAGGRPWLLISNTAVSGLPVGGFSIWDGGVSANRLSIDTGGNVTIPNLLFSSAGVVFPNNTPLYWVDPGAATRRVGLWSSSNIYWGDIDNSNNSNLLFLAGGSGVINFYTNGGAKLIINNAGAVRFVAYGAGALVTDASGNITATSDERLKTDIVPFTRGLTDLLAVKPIGFLWSKASGLDTAQRYYGFSAQNLQSCLPEAVGKMNNTGTQYLTLQERPILAAIVNALAEIDSRLVALEPKKPKK